jgi:hypothetical protein
LLSVANPVVREIRIVCLKLELDVVTALVKYVLFIHLDDVSDEPLITLRSSAEAE